MNNPVFKSDISVKRAKRGRQAVSPENPVGKRVLQALGDKDYAWLSAKTGIAASTLSDQVRTGGFRADGALKIADALKVPIEWLLRGAAPQGLAAHPIDAADADWMVRPEGDGATLSETNKGEVVSSTVFRRDWLKLSFGRDKGLWVTQMPSDYPPLGLDEGDNIICCDISREELKERQLCIWHLPVFGKLVVARYSVIDRGNHIVAIEDGDYWAHPHLIEGEITDGSSPDMVPVGRILGRPLAPIR